MSARKRQPISFIERNIHLSLSNPNHTQQLMLLGKALSSKDRLRVLGALRGRSLSVVEVATKLSLPVSSVAFHYKVLEEAGLIITESQPGVKGSMRIGLCSAQMLSLNILDQSMLTQDSVYTAEMPIGNFFDCQITPTCGLASETGMIGQYDDRRSFFLPQRHEAQLIWFQSGYLEYRFANPLYREQQPTAISFSMELCSEAPGYQEKWPSKIRFSINSMPVGAFLCPGDFGSRRGYLTPDYWPMGSTQYGLLKTLSVRAQGAYIDEEPVNEKISVQDLRLTSQPYISLRIETDSKEQSYGGINLFGEKFGDFPQSIRMHVQYQSPAHGQPKAEGGEG